MPSTKRDIGEGGGLPGADIKKCTFYSIVLHILRIYFNVEEAGYRHGAPRFQNNRGKAMGTCGGKVLRIHVPGTSYSGV